MSVQELKQVSKEQQNVRIIGFGEFLPGEPVDNEQMEQIFSIRKEWVELMIGNESRHFAIDFKNRKIDYDLKQLCTLAAEQAINDANINVDEIELIILSTATPDHLMPSTVNMVADDLGLTNIRTYQIQAGCSGSLQGLDVAQQFLKTGAISKALVIGGDVCNKYMDLNKDYSKLKSSELINYALFGDGAGAVVLTTDNVSGLEISHIENRFEGLNKKPGQVMNWFGNIPENINTMEKKEIRQKFQSANEDYKAIERYVPEMAQEMLKELLSNINTQDKVVYYLTPQLGGNMTDKINDSLNLNPDSIINCVKKTGNNGNALPYMQLKKVSSKLKDKDLVLGISIESSKWIKTGITLEFKEVDSNAEE